MIDVPGTLSSGQVFLWRHVGVFWYVIDGQNILKVDDTGVIDATRTITDFFRCGDDIDRMHESFAQDPLLTELIHRYEGLRITNQNLFQCVISFIVSANSNIPRIRRNLQDICHRFGDKTAYDDIAFCLFPTPAVLAGTDTHHIRECGVGYRAQHIQGASAAIRDGLCDGIDRMSYKEAQGTLCEMPGVGRKVADCILLFSCGHLEAVPLDRWIIRVMHEHYGIGDGTTPHTTRQYDTLHDDVRDRLGPYAGYAQQYLFKMARNNSEKPLKW
ncbi:MAG: DNA repair protein [Cenarchaeum sp. SB0666_bin_15]|nr:DNA repair protein [Cenarchaeum sp. SB0666_bin_15]MYJ27755.1 DNA repair protein [Cenarchaeum sp. SB0672_bin_9]